MSRETHYRCDKVHFNRKGEISIRRHAGDCQTAPGHVGTTVRCPACRDEYLARFWAKDENKTRYRERRRRRSPSHPHYACDQPPEAHPIKRGVGRDHRAGCPVAEGHTPGVSAGGRAGCPACALIRNRRSYRSGALRRKYKMTVSDYDRLLAAQNGRCAICGREPSPTLRLAVDHDHRTDAKRGLLCRGCNLGLGNFGDDPAVLARAIAYLARGYDLTA